MESRPAAVVRSVRFMLVVAVLVVCLGAAMTASADRSTRASGEAQALRALLVAQQAQLVAADGVAMDRFGSEVAISGDTAVVGCSTDQVGANYAQGSAYVFVRSGATWSQQAQLTAGDGAADDYFGSSVAIAGDTVVIGASGDSIGASSQQGSTYVFTRSGTSWTYQQKLVAAGGSAYDSFGCSVTISGDTVAIGAYRDDVGADENQGSAHVFVRSGTIWTQQQELTAIDGSADDRFGHSVAISGDTVAVGADEDDIGIKVDAGSAYVFERTGAVWSLKAQLTAADGAGYDEFGSPIAISGATVVVGTSLHTVGTNRNQGSAYVFVRGGVTWSQQARLTAADGATDDLFGIAVAISDDTVVIGADFDDVGLNAYQGSAYVFVRCGSKWSQFHKLTATDGAASDYFGNAVAISGATAVIGTPRDDVGANVDQGSAYVFRVAKPARPAARSPKGTISSRTPTFRWRAAAGAATYEVRIYKGSRLLKKQAGIAKTMWKCTKRLPRQAWLTWQVRARNTAGYSAYSAKLRFRVR